MYMKKTKWRMEENDLSQFSLINLFSTVKDSKI